jgi:large subunit ribosomal protein L31
MNTSIHPEYVDSHVTCTCGADFMTRSTKAQIHVEICSECHPFYTGKQKLVDTGGRVERFQRRVAKGRHAARTTTGIGAGTGTAIGAGTGVGTGSGTGTPTGA